MTAETQRVVTIKAEPLTPEAYAPFGTVVDKGLCQLHCSDGQYTARLMSLERFDGRVGRINRHFDHSQLFVPISRDPMLIVVAPSHVAGDAFDPEQVRAFVNDGTKAFTFNVGVWHIAPRAIGQGGDPQVINVQGSRYMQHTELIDFAAQTGAVVAVEL